MRRSQSTSRIRCPTLIDITRARFTAAVVFPSPGVALVTAIVRSSERGATAVDPGAQAAELLGDEGLGL